jgi:hypothetical protein
MLISYSQTACNWKFKSSRTTLLHVVIHGVVPSIFMLHHFLLSLLAGHSHSHGGCWLLCSPIFQPTGRIKIAQDKPSEKMTQRFSSHLIGLNLVTCQWLAMEDNIVGNVARFWIAQVKLGYCILKEPFSRDSIARHHM